MKFAEYSHTNSESLAQIHATFNEIQNCILGDCLLLAHPSCTSATIVGSYAHDYTHNKAEYTAAIKLLPATKAILYIYN